MAKHYQSKQPAPGGKKQIFNVVRYGGKWTYIMVFKRQDKVAERAGWLAVVGYAADLPDKPFSLVHVV